MDDIRLLRLQLALGDLADEDVCIVNVGDLRALLLEWEDRDPFYSGEDYLGDEAVQ